MCEPSTHHPGLTIPLHKDKTLQVNSKMIYCVERDISFMMGAVRPRPADHDNQSFNSILKRIDPN